MDLFKKSVNVLKSLQLENGGILAAPNKSAYPYVYPRDSVIITKALNYSGENKKSEKFYYFMKKISKLDNYKELFHRYDLEGRPSATRREENDGVGLILHGIYDTYLSGKKESFLEDMWPFIEKLSDLIFSYSKSGLVRTQRSIHEFFRLENGYELWTNCACWRGLKDASEIAKILGHKEKNEKWSKKANQIGENINKNLFDKKRNLFVKKIGLEETPDISQLSPFYFGLSNSKRVLRKTMSHLRKHLWHKELGGFRRFRKFDIVEDWHWYTGGSGSWCVFTAWGAKFYKILNEREKSNECVNWIKKVASRTNGLLPEHIATKREYEDWKNHEIEFNQRLVIGTKISENLAKNFKEKNKLIYWGIPLGWSHAEYILINKNDNYN